MSVLALAAEALIHGRRATGEADRLHVTPEARACPKKRSKPSHDSSRDRLDRANNDLLHDLPTSTLD